MKKLLLVLVMLMVLVGCAKDDGKKDVAILQLMSHDALNLAKDGFMDALNDGGYFEDDNLSINYQNPEGDNSNMVTMAESIIASSPDLVLSIATTPTQALQNINDNTPILATAITDFKEAGLGDDSLISGVSDACSMSEQLKLILEVVPNLKTLGIIYTSSEPNSKIQAEQMISECNKLGIDTLVKTVSDKTMISDTLQAFNGKIDALYIPTDNNLASAMGSVDVYASEHKLPILCAESNSLKNGGLVSLGVDYYKIGYQTGEMAVAILNGEKTIDELEISSQSKFDVYYNSSTANKLGIELPSSITEVGIDVGK